MAAVVLGVSAPSSAGTRTASVALTGAGSTFDAPFFNVALAKYHQLHRGVTIGYSAVGSGAGIKSFSNKEVNFGATDVPMTSSEQAGALGGKSAQVPVDLGAEVVVFNHAEAVLATASPAPKPLTFDEVLKTLTALRDLPEFLEHIETADREALYQALGLTVRYRRNGSSEEVNLNSMLRSVDLERVGETALRETPRSQAQGAWTWSVSEGGLQP